MSTLYDETFKYNGRELNVTVFIDSTDDYRHPIHVRTRWLGLIGHGTGQTEEESLNTALRHLFDQITLIHHALNGGK